MDLNAAQKLAVNLMDRHGLIAQGWTFKFDAAKNRIGLCTFTSKTISMSRDHISFGDQELAEQTMLHEIAHALVGHAPRNAYGKVEGGHGNVWKAKARSIGYTGKRTASTELQKAKDAAVIAEARAREASVAHITSGPFQMGERVQTSNAKYRGLMLNTLQTRGRILNDRDQKVWTIPLSSLQRGSVAPAQPSLPAAPTAPPVTTRQAVIGRAPRLEPLTFRKHDAILIHRPGSGLHGLRGTVTRVNQKTISILLADGREFRAGASLLRHDDD